MIVISADFVACVALVVLQIYKSDLLQTSDAKSINDLLLNVRKSLKFFTYLLP